MNVLIRPESLSLSGNIERFRIVSAEKVSFVLSMGMKEILSSVYTPGADGLITIDIREIVESQLSFTLKDIATPYEQSSLVADFTARLDDTTYTFRVIRSGVDRLSIPAIDFLNGNFLTWQPQLKPVTYYSPEFLTYYAGVPSYLKVKAYFTDREGNTTSVVKQLASMVAGHAYTVSLQYAVIAGLFDSQLPSFYDAWVENASGNRLTYIQRYVATDILSEQEQWVLFENSLGGIDSFRAHGQCDFTGEHTHNIAEIDDVSQEYRVDTERKFQKSTGYLDDRQRRWLLDFFPSRAKFIYQGNSLRSIVVTESNVTYTDKELPSEYKFTYRYADARPYLNLPRAEALPSFLTISVPDLGSFTIPPRLIEFPSQPLSEGVMFPVQNPFSEDWSTTTIGGIFNYILNRIYADYSGGGGIGHAHVNFDLLQLFSYVDEYLLVNGKKIKAGWADSLSEEGDQKYLHKDRADSTKFLLSLLGGAVFGKNGFASGLTGFGAKIDELGYGEMRGLRLWEFLELPELRFNRVEVFLGIKWRVPGAGIVESVAIDTDADGNELSTGTVTLKLEEGEFGGISLDDIALGIYHYENPSDNATGDTDDSKGNFSFAGFGTSYFRITEVMGEKHNQFRYALRPGFKLHPRSQMHFSCYGNFTDKDRQTSVYETRTYTRMLWKQNTWEISVGNIAMQQGDLSNLAIHGLQMDGYSMYLNNVYFTGTITQVKPDGTPIRTANEREEWVSGKYDYYDRVSHNGCIWLCVDENGTDTEPSTANSAWLLQVDKGESGISITNCGPWYTGLLVPKMAVVTMGGSAFLSKVATRNPPLWCFTDNSGNRLLYKDGGYVLTGDVNTAEYELLVQSGGDGKDGTDYEYVYIHTTGSKPSRPITSQQDDYIPAGWHDDPMGASESLPFEWVCKREKRDGLWSEFTDPSIWVKYGFDGLGISEADVLYALSDSNSVAPVSGWQTTAPAWENGKYLWSKTVTVYSDGSTVETSPACISGGKGIKSAVEYYYKSSSATSLAGGSWVTTYPGWENGKYLWTKTIITYTDGTASETVPVCVTGDKGDQGDKGEGYTQVGRWYTGLLVPKMGVVTMGGGSYVAKVATRNPPLWCFTDNSGNRLLYKDGGYVLTGEINTAEYDVWAEKGDTGATGGKGDTGDDGKPGETGKQGIDGCVKRDSEWAVGVEYRNDSAITDGSLPIRYVDIALVRNNATETGWDAYQCLKTHVSSGSITYTNTSYWQKFGANVSAIFASLIIAKNAKINFLQGNQLLIQKSDGIVTAGLSGSDSGQKIRIWAGAATPDEAPFRVSESGELVATKANITGTITAEKGTIGGFSIGSNYIGSTNMQTTNTDNIRIAYGGIEMTYWLLKQIDGHLYSGLSKTVLNPGSISISKTDDNASTGTVLYARFGKYILSVGADGIRKSTNGGSTWIDL